MRVTTRDLFNLLNPPQKYKTFLKETKLQDGELSEASDLYEDTLAAKQSGELRGEQVQHNRSDDEVDIG